MCRKVSILLDLEKTLALSFGFPSPGTMRSARNHLACWMRHMRYHPFSLPLSPHGNDVVLFCTVFLNHMCCERHSSFFPDHSQGPPSHRQHFTGGWNWGDGKGCLEGIDYQCILCIRSMDMDTGKGHYSQWVICEPSTLVSLPSHP